jgi:hypothetical protein
MYGIFQIQLMLQVSASLAFLCMVCSMFWQICFSVAEYKLEGPETNTLKSCNLSYYVLI